VPGGPAGHAGRDTGHQAHGHTPDWALPTGLAGATLLATWASVEARRRHSYRLRRAKGGSVLPPPDPTIAPTAVAVAANTNVDATERLDAALRHLAAIETGPVPPRPQVVLRHGNGELEVYLAMPAERAVAPWVARADGRIWALPPDATLDVALGVPPPCPALVQLGTCDDGADLYADLEALGTIGIAGVGEAIRQIARAITATLVVSPAARQCRILTWGFDAYGLAEQAPTRLVVADTIDDLLGEARATARPILEALDEDPRIESSFYLRAAVPDEGWEPALIVAAGSPLAPREAAALADLGGAGGRGAAVIVSGADAAFTLVAAEPAGWWRLDPFGIPVRPIALAADELRDLAGYLAEADTEPVSLDRSPEQRSPSATTGAENLGDSATSAVGVASPERDWRVMVRLLGMVDVVDRDGRSAVGDRDQPVELLAWLATHRDTATRSGATDALWAGRRVEPRTLTNVISAARNLLRALAGEPPDGGEWIPSRQERLILHSAVVSDCELLFDRLQRARRLPPADAATVLSSGAPLMRGAPLQGADWLWADDQSLRSRLAVQAVELATRLATFRLEAGDVRGAAEAADLGHAVIPFHDECTALSIEALAAGGDRAGALARFDDYERQAIARGESIAPEIAKLRNTLLRA
jgi:hypothetical protein